MLIAAFCFDATLAADTVSARRMLPLYARMRRAAYFAAAACHAAASCQFRCQRFRLLMPAIAGAAD